MTIINKLNHLNQSLLKPAENDNKLGQNRNNNWNFYQWQKHQQCKQLQGTNGVAYIK